MSNFSINSVDINGASLCIGCSLWALTLINLAGNWIWARYYNSIKKTQPEDKYLWPLYKKQGKIIFQNAPFISNKGIPIFFFNFQILNPKLHTHQKPLIKFTGQIQTSHINWDGLFDLHHIGYRLSESDRITPMRHLSNRPHLLRIGSVSIPILHALNPSYARDLMSLALWQGSDTKYVANCDTRDNGRLCCSKRQLDSNQFLYATVNPMARLSETKHTALDRIFPIQIILDPDFPRERRRSSFQLWFKTGDRLWLEGGN